MICYDRLWATMEDRGMTQYRLIKQHSFSAGQIGRLKKNMHVSTHTLETLCSILECGISDVVEFIPEGGSHGSQSSQKQEHLEPTVQKTEGQETLRGTSGGQETLTKESVSHETLPATESKTSPPKADKTKKAGKSKKGDKKTSKEGKKGKDSKKSK